MNANHQLAPASAQMRRLPVSRRRKQWKPLESLASNLRMENGRCGGKVHGAALRADVRFSPSGATARWLQCCYVC